MPRTLQQQPWVSAEPRVHRRRAWCTFFFVKLKTTQLRSNKPSKLIFESCVRYLLLWTVCFDRGGNRQPWVWAKPCVHRSRTPCICWWTVCFDHQWKHVFNKRPFFKDGNSAFLFAGSPLLSRDFHPLPDRCHSKLAVDSCTVVDLQPSKNGCRRVCRK